MTAAWYDRQGPAAEVLHVGELPVPQPGSSTPSARALTMPGPGTRVWVYGVQSDRPSGTAAQLTVVPAAQAIPPLIGQR
jgi:NADPH2:quinone reductase